MQARQKFFVGLQDVGQGGRMNNKALIEALSNASSYSFPKYTTQILNLVNSNAQGTRPAVVGQMSELIKQFDGKSLSEWIECYNSKQPNAVYSATEKVYSKFL